jgi:hypothetical protein
MFRHSCASAAMLCEGRAHIRVVRMKRFAVECRIFSVTSNPLLWALELK